jgi:N-acetylglucosamine kinase-like BadF-type ATPase
MTQWYLGMDGGQSTTKGLIADQTGQVRGAGQAGPCNHVATELSQARFREAVTGCLQSALQAAGLPSNTAFHAACLGMSGGPADKEFLARAVVRAEKLLVTTDAQVALIGATGGEPGIVAISGTGSIAYGRNAAGKFARAGGWGYIYGDEGGAFDLVRQAVRAALRNEEGWGPKTDLRSMFLDGTGATTMNELLHRFYTPEYPRRKIASYAEFVDRCAKEGDGVARDILKESAHHLATYVAAVRRQLFHRGETARISFIGGVFRSDILREHFQLLAELDEIGRAHV